MFITRSLHPLRFRKYMQEKIVVRHFKVNAEFN